MMYCVYSCRRCKEVFYRSAIYRIEVIRCPNCWNDDLDLLRCDEE